MWQLIYGWWIIYGCWKNKLDSYLFIIIIIIIIIRNSHKAIFFCYQASKNQTLRQVEFIRITKKIPKDIFIQILLTGLLIRLTNHLCVVFKYENINCSLFLTVFSLSNDIQ